MTSSTLFARALAMLPPSACPAQHVAQSARLAIATTCLANGSLLWRPGRGPAPRRGEA